jgi:LPS-assembly lipoprotein
MPTSNSRRRILLAALGLPIVSACGFRLRQARPLPFASISVGVTEYSEFGLALRRQIEASGNTEVVTEPAQAEVRLLVLRDSRSREITSLNSAGKVREYELRRAFSFRLVDKAGTERVPTSTIEVRRRMTFNDSEVLTKELEEAVLYKDMDKDVVRQIMRRLEAVPPAPR